MIGTLVCLALTLITGLPGIHLIYIERFKLFLFGIVFPTLMPFFMAISGSVLAYFYSSDVAVFTNPLNSSIPLFVASGVLVSFIGWAVAWVINIGTAVLLVLEKLSDGRGSLIVWSHSNSMQPLTES